MVSKQTADSHRMGVPVEQQAVQFIGGPLENMGGVSLTGALERVPESDWHGPEGVMVFNYPGPPEDPAPRYAAYVLDESTLTATYDGEADPPQALRREGGDA